MTITVAAAMTVIVVHPNAGTMRSTITRNFVYENVSPFMPGVGERGEEIAVPIPDLRPSTFSPDIADVPRLCRRMFDSEAHWGLLGIQHASFVVRCAISLPPGTAYLKDWVKEHEVALEGVVVKFGLPDLATSIAADFDQALAKVFLLWLSIKLPEVPG